MSSWRQKTIAFVLSSTASATFVGLILGLVGGQLALNVRLALASLLAIVGLFIGTGALVFPHWKPLQCDRETPQRWMQHGPLPWAVQNGAFLGVGATSRIAFWLWYAVPIGAFLVGTPQWGAIVYGAYGLSRSGAILGRFWGLALRRPIDEVDDWLLQHHELAKRFTAAQLLMLSIAIAILIGL